jgi:hypothetical protein
MYRFTVKVERSDRLRADDVVVRSTLDRTQKLALGTEEDIVVGPNDVTVIRNEAKDETARLVMRGLKMDQDGFVVCQPSRQQHFKLWHGRSIDVELGAGESMVIRSGVARDPYTRTLPDQINGRL